LGGTLFRTDATTFAVEKVCNEVTLGIQVISHVRTEDIAQPTMNTEFLIENWLEGLPIPCPILTGIAGLQDNITDWQFLPCPF
jgi:hypothetical protein